MNCDIYILFGKTNEQFIITSKQDISTLPKDNTYTIQVPEMALDSVSTSDQAIALLFDGKQRLGVTHNGHNISDADMIKAFMDLHKKANSTLDTSDMVDRLGKNIHFLDNITYDELKQKFPLETDILPDIAPRDYHLSLIQDASLQGESMYDRMFVNGIETFVLRNAEDVKRFALTEKALYQLNDLVGKTLYDGTVDNNFINDENNSRKDLLRRIYQQDFITIISTISNSDTKALKAIKERITLEQGVSDITIKSLLTDYLYHVSEYRFRFNKDGKSRIAGSIINNFFEEIKGELVSYTEDEDEFTSMLKDLNVKRDEFGKSDLYDALADFYGESFTNQYPFNVFAKADKQKMTEILTPFFKEHASIANFQIDYLDETKDEKTKLTDKQIVALFNKNVKRLNKTRKKGDKIKGSLPDLVTDVESAKQYVGQEVIINKHTYKLDIVEEDGQIVYYYNRINMANSQKIKFKYTGQTLEETFDLTDFGLDTFEYITPCNESEGTDKVIDGEYHGFYIYETHYPNKTTQYFISNSVVSPKLYLLDGSLFNTLEKAKLAVLSYNSKRNIKRATNVALKYNTPTKATVVLLNNSAVGQTIDSLNVPIEQSTVNNLEGSEANIFNNGNLVSFQSFYQSYYKKGEYEGSRVAKIRERIIEALDTIDTPEKAGLFILKLAENNIASYQNPQPSKTNLELVLSIIHEINSASKNQYLVRESKRKTPDVDNNLRETIYLTNLQALSDANLTVNSQGKIVETNIPAYKSLTLALHDLAKVINNGLLADSGIQIKITDNESLKKDEEFYDENGVSIFDKVEDMRTIRGFVYNGTIYINQSNIERSVKTLYHEVLHIVLGAIRAQDRRKAEAGSNEPPVYEQILAYYENKWKNDPDDKLLQTIANSVFQNYRLAYQDQWEEIVVRYLANSLGNTKAMYLNSTSDQFQETILKELLKQFQVINKQVNSILNSDKNFDLGFVSDLIKADGTRNDIIQQTKVTSLIERGIKAGTIKQKCV